MPLVKSMEIYIRTQEEFDEVATKLCATASLPDLQVQPREGLNLGGGHYFLFTTGQNEVVFCRNHGEVKVERMPNHGFYLWVHQGDDTILEAFRNACQKLDIEHETGNWT